MSLQPKNPYAELKPDSKGLYDVDGVKRNKEEVVFIGSKLYWKEDHRVAIDLFNGVYRLKGNMLPVMSDFTLVDGLLKDAIQDKYTTNPEVLPICCINGSRYYAESVELLTKYGFVEGIKSGAFFQPYELPRDTQVEYRKFNNIRSLRNTELSEQHKFGLSSPTYLLTEGKRYTFGVEIETSQGVIPAHVSNHLNLKSLRDGSVDSAEYVTGVLTGDAGIMHLQKITGEIAKRCRVDHKCSVHVHIGGVIFNKEFIVYAFELAKLVENDIFRMLPPSRSQSSYCKKMSKLKLDLSKLTTNKLEYKIALDELYNEIFAYISHVGSYPDARYNKSSDHPLGPHCNYNREAPRYCWLNFVTAMFDTRQIPGSATLEFRAHSATLSFTKILNWLKICMAFVSFAENNQQDILRGGILFKDQQDETLTPITLENIIKVAYPKTHEKLINYIRQRQDLFKDDYTAELNEEQEYKKTRISEMKELKVKELI